MQDKRDGAFALTSRVKPPDFVLVYDPAKNGCQQIRDTFEEELKRVGLILERVQSSLSGEARMYVKITVPWQVLSKYAAEMRIKMPVKKSGESSEVDQTQDWPQLGSYSTKAIMRKQDVAVFSGLKEHLFDIPEVKENFFSSAQRSQIVNYILHQQLPQMRGEKPLEFSFNDLLGDMTYLAAYPLHEDSNQPLRCRLLNEWASIFSAFNYQPLDDIVRYFGPKVGLYFAWLGFYTFMLIPASIGGIICFLYGIISVHMNDPRLDICAQAEEIIMCPTCDKECEYWKLGEYCGRSMMVSLFDNAATVLFSMFMAVWSAAVLQLWKRYCNRLKYQWSLTDSDNIEENFRPEYVAKKRAEKSTGQEPWKAPFWRRKLPYKIVSYSVIFLSVLLCISAAVGVILYRGTLYAVLVVKGGDEVYAPVIVTLTAAFLNFFCIVIFNMIYSKAAGWLTDMEMPRTQHEYDDSLTLKLYLLQYVNSYSSIFYIALFKGKFLGRPGNYNYVLGHYQQETCGTGGCFHELSIQLAVIMIGQQALSTIHNFFWPVFKQFLQARGIGGAQDKMTNDGTDVNDDRLWERDYCLPQMGQMGLNFEYLKMILQYGFVTLFIAAFPVAPVFALINNSIEIRFDAIKLLKHFRRPVAQRVKDIGVWYEIMDSLAKLAVLSNAIIIAFTSEFIPRMYYMFKYNPNGNLVGYVNFTLSTFDVRDYDVDVIHRKAHLLGNSTFCRYSDYRTPPWESNHAYNRTIVFWEIFVWRLTFVVLFENVIVVLVTLIRWLIPDIQRSRIQARTTSSRSSSD